MTKFIFYVTKLRLVSRDAFALSSSWFVHNRATEESASYNYVYSVAPRSESDELFATDRKVTLFISRKRHAL